MKMKNDHWMTLAEHDALLKSEGRYDAMKEIQRQREEERQRKVSEWRKAEIPIIEALRSRGFEVKSVWDLVNTKRRYPDAVPVLLEHLSQSYPERVREGIARALAVPEARSGWQILLETFRRETDTTTVGVKWALALALGATGTDEVLDDVFALLRDKSLGENRVPLLQILCRSNDPRSFELLNELKDDESIGRDVKLALRKLRVRTSKSLHS
jgi:HEAT repeat protein